MALILMSATCAALLAPAYLVDDAPMAISRLDDLDRDGVRFDECPDQPGLGISNGCPLSPDLDIVSACKERSRGLGEGRLFFDPAAEMTVGQAETVRAVVSVDLATEPTEALPDVVGPASVPVEVSCVVEARLEAPEGDFSIEPDGFSPAVVLPGRDAEWSWLVRADRVGNGQRMQLTVQSILDDGEGRFPVGAHSTTVTIDVDVGQETRILEAWLDDALTRSEVELSHSEFEVGTAVPVSVALDLASAGSPPIAAVGANRVTGVLVVASVETHLAVEPPSRLGHIRVTDEGLESASLDFPFTLSPVKAAEAHPMMVTALFSYERLGPDGYEPIASIEARRDYEISVTILEPPKSILDWVETVLTHPLFTALFGSGLLVVTVSGVFAYRRRKAERNGSRGQPTTGEARREEAPDRIDVPTIFICYRRRDAAGSVGRLHDRIVGIVGEDHVFMDFEDILPGQDFVAALETAIDRSGVVLAVIGPTWLTQTDTRGQPRIYSSTDHVAREIRLGLEGRKTVVPVLVDGAEMPEAEDLPEPIRRLNRLNAFRLDPDTFGDDVDRLIESIRAPAGAPD